MSSTELEWPILRKILFFFFSIFIFLYAIPFPFNMYADELFMDGLVYKIWNLPVQWISKNILGNKKALSTEVTGSGDTTFHWILFFLFIVISLVSALFISLIDRRRKSYNQFFEYTKVYVRYYLAYFLLFYGIIKLFYLQMPSPYLTALDQPLGDFSPMGLLWTFIGASKSYSIFTGLIETLAGSLLLFRRTSFLGAFLALLVMVHVFILNMCYDVPVKLFSFFLIIVSLYLLYPQMNNLYHFFISKKQLMVDEDDFLFKNTKWYKPMLIFKIFIVMWMYYTNITSSMKGQKEYGSLAPKPPLYGKYVAKTFSRNDTIFHPSWNDSTIWKEIIIDKYSEEFARVVMVSGLKKTVSFRVDTVSRTILYGLERDIPTDTLVYTEFQNNQLLIENKNMKFLLDRKDDYLLLDRGFHWVNEFPYSR
jgi:hypothetical protein